MQLIRTPVLLLCLCAGAAEATDKHIWACRTEHPAAKPILHLVEWGTRSYVKFAHMRFAARYEREDEHQGWYWSNEGGGYYRYGLLLDSDGKAWFHDFMQRDDEGLSPPIDRFTCRNDS